MGEKWSWTFTYYDEDAVDGEPVYDAGSPSDPTELWLPVDEIVRFGAVGDKPQREIEGQDTGSPPSAFAEAAAD